ncbi:MAG: (2Fe-2S) ferredoxin domain-containing protein, partial [Spirochaetaceae bacterium]|nr:(2Fe-2S) ferredoxin domain-containing protein [Spirochaetaceae bacterium]
MAIKNYCLVCGGAGCDAGKADAIYHGLRSAAETNGISDDIQIVKTGCFGLCEKGPIVKVLPGETFYIGVKPEDAEIIVREHLMK